MVFFSETGASTFFKYPLHRLFGKCVLLDILVLPSQIDILVKKIVHVRSDLERLALVENFLIRRLNSRPNNSQIVLAVDLIKKNSGNLKMRMLANQIKISQSQLEKRFRKIVGATPKKFASIARFRNVLCIGAYERNMTRLGLEAGYFDQAHFIKDFKSFTGLTPERYFKIK